MVEKMKILLLEDDMILNEIIEEYLLENKYDVKTTTNSQEALELIYDNLFDILLLDVNVPYLNGFSLLKKLRKNSIYVPTIFITSKNQADDMQEGFEAGCDDYIKKPFDLDELNLRIKNLKRLYSIDSTFVKIAPNLCYDGSNRIILKDEVKYQLSKMEAKVFEYLYKNKNRAVSIEEIGLNNWVYDDIPIDTTIRTYIKNLRKIVGKETIETIKSIGYKLKTA
ncbi:DNA-binding response OmpR family regulator [Malaciobacter marinus]|jgi:DNA-binding response OmpR family regulator|uniref:DNA-binding response OmpR family regulator n=2 Tax=Malaciobacter marinus TaxID=505249 RepID=A0AB36ZYW8_9BACT|nr:DNA-binding response OmpR family regulator [Malaciobacter marinus]SKB46128.1 DNA-binding response regulator, OmpR family, contains REC and winged-helix (wHTH) domain [Malaciobacter marinus]